MNRSKTVHLFCLNEGEGLYNGKSRSVFVSCFVKMER